MTISKHFFWLMLLPFVVGARDAYAAPKTSAQRFATMVQAIASIKAEEKDSNGNMSREAVIAVDNAKRVTTLIDTIEKLFEQKAFASFPGIKIQFYELFNKFPQLSWPSVSDVRHMRHDVTEFCSLFKQVLLLSSAKNIDRELLLNMSMLCNCLITNILQDDFFEFNLGQKAFDICFNQPVELMCESPHLIIGSIIVFIGSTTWLISQCANEGGKETEKETEAARKGQVIILANNSTEWDDDDFVNPTYQTMKLMLYYQLLQEQDNTDRHRRRLEKIHNDTEHRLYMMKMLEELKTQRQSCRIKRPIKSSAWDGDCKKNVAKKVIW